MLTLYCTPGTISVAVLIALTETEVPFRAVKVDFATAAQTQAEYHAINPKGRVPALVTDGGTLTETGAILDYIGAQTGKLVPASPFAAARMREVMYYLASTMHVNHAHKMRGQRWADQESSFADMRAKVPQTMAASAAYLEAAFPFDPFVTGPAMTLADPYLYVVLNWLPGDGVDTDAYPKIATYLERMRARPSVRAMYRQGFLQ